MDLTPEQRALPAAEVVRACLEESPDDADAALAAAGEILRTNSPDQLRQLFGDERRRDFARMPKPINAASALERKQMRGMLRTLNKALAGTAEKHADIRLALQDEEPTTALLYGAGPVTVGDYGFPEVGAATEGALQTAAEPKAGRKRARGKAGRKRRRSLARGLRVPKKWTPGYIDPFGRRPA